MAQRQSNRDRFDPYGDEIRAQNDESYGGGRGYRDQEREPWQGEGGRGRGEGWRGGRGYEFESGRAPGGERWSEDQGEGGWRSGQQRGGYGGYGGGQGSYGGHSSYGGGQASQGSGYGGQGGYGGAGQGAQWGQGGPYGGGPGTYGGQRYGGQGYGGGQGYSGAQGSQWGQGADQGNYGGEAYGGQRYGGQDAGGRGMHWGQGGSMGGPQSGAEGWAGGGWGMGQGGETHRGRAPKGYERSDDRIKETICERLTEHHEIDPSEVSVQVSKGEVTLEGCVEDRMTKHRIEDLIDSCGGVKEIHNNLRISSSQQWAGTRGQQQGQPQQSDKSARTASGSNEQAGDSGATRR